MKDYDFSFSQMEKDLRLLSQILEAGPCGLCKFDKEYDAPCTYCPAQGYDY